MWIIVTFALALKMAGPLAVDIHRRQCLHQMKSTNVGINVLLEPLPKLFQEDQMGQFQV